MMLTKFKLGLLAAAVIAAATTSLVIQHHAQVRLRLENEDLRQQLAGVPELQANHERLSNLAVHASSPLPSERDDLLRLRSEVTRLRQQTNELARLRDDNRRLRETQPAASDTEKEAARQRGVAKLNDSRAIVLGIIMYATDHENRFPTNEDLAAPYLHLEQLTGTNQFQLVFQGSLTTLTNPASTIVLRETQPWFSGGKWARTYGFADGHSEIHSETDGNLEAWERARMIPPDAAGQ